MPTLERLNRLNQRVSKAKRRAEQSRAEVDQRLRGITERSERAKRSLSEHSEELYRELTESKSIGVSSQLFERTKQKVSRTIRVVTQTIKKVLKNKEIKIKIEREIMKR